jgi:2-haloacid dehalogenase
MSVKALVFDVFGTVVDWRTSIVEQFQAFGREKGITVNWEAFVDDWKSCYRPGMDAVREGRLPWTNVDGIYRTKLDALLGKYGITRLSEAETIRLNRAWHRCKPWPDVVAGLTRLKAKYLTFPLCCCDQISCFFPKRTT